MLRLTKRIEYALISLNHINHYGNNGPVKTKDIAKIYNLPQEILAKTLQKLSGENIIASIHGRNGGYILNTSMDDINLMDFIETIEGPFGIVDCNINKDCQQIEHCNIKSPITKINDNLKNIFKKIKLTEIT